ncbi:MAG TPA: caspase family protein [Burkholderiaceae bacterium]|nr:caspase family protein [Burkholderiaceae bacterium]
MESCNGPARPTVRSTLRRWVASLVAPMLVALTIAAPTPSNAQAMRGVSITEQRVALVIGNADYKRDELDNPVNDARLMQRTLDKAGFKVTLRENLDRAGMLAALREFGEQLNENTVAVMYYAGHALQLRDHNFMIPVDAEIRTEDEVAIQGMDLGYVLGQMSRAKSRVNVVILDACRDNPFAKRAPTLSAGLAQMDAPIGTLLAYATAPGKKAPDGIGKGGNSVYTAQLAQNLLTPGLPIELMFKRVREGVVRESGQLQVPWEHSSLLGEFAFVPGVNESREAAESDGGAEVALWNSIKDSKRADDFRAYRRQYPNGRFAEQAQARINELSAVVAGAGSRTQLMPRVGDTWRYRVIDQFRFGDLFVTARVDAVSDDSVAETWTTTVDAKVRTTRVSLKPGFNPLPDWSVAPPEFAPYLQASDVPPGASAAIGEQRRAIDAVPMTLQPSWQPEEEVTVGAGRFRAQKLVLRGQAGSARGGGPLRAEYVVWYAPGVRRIVKYQVLAFAGGRLRESTTFELTEYKLQ